MKNLLLLTLVIGSLNAHAKWPDGTACDGAGQPACWDCDEGNANSAVDDQWHCGDESFAIAHIKPGVSVKSIKHRVFVNPKQGATKVKVR